LIIIFLIVCVFIPSTEGDLMLADGQDSSEEGKGYEAGGQRYSDDTVREPCNVMICDLMLYQIEDVF
jgi:hypothetical protein